MSRANERMDVLKLWEAEMGFSRILVAVDGSPIAAEAVKTALALATALGAEVQTLFVMDPHISCSSEIGPPLEELLELAVDEERRIRMELRAAVAIPEAVNHLVRVGNPADVISEVAVHWPADLVAVGSHGRSGLGRVLLGSVAEAVVRHAPCPVLVVRKQHAVVTASDEHHPV